MWTQEQDQIIRDNHGKKTLPQIMKLLNVTTEDITYSGFRAKCQRMGLFRDKSLVRIPLKNFHNDEYWKTLTLINCMLAGMVATDGCILLLKSGSYRLSYKVSQKDEILIDLLKKELNFTGKKIYTKSKSPHSYNISNFVEIAVGVFDKNAVYLKQHFNLVPNKTFRLGPINIEDKNLILCYISGAIIGDGSVEYRKIVKGDKTYDSITTGVCSVSKPFLEWIKLKIDEYFPKVGCRECNLSLQKRDNVWKFYVSGLRAAIILDYLKQLPIPLLPRKFENPKVVEYIENKKKQYPNLFHKPILSV